MMPPSRNTFNAACMSSLSYRIIRNLGYKGTIKYWIWQINSAILRNFLKKIVSPLHNCKKCSTFVAGLVTNNVKFQNYILQ